MAVRGISKEDVEGTVDDHEMSYPSEVAGRECRIRNIGNRRVEVVVALRGDEIWIITAVDQLDEGE